MLLQRPHHPFNFLQNFPRLNQRLHRVVVRIQRPVHLQVRHVAGDLACGLHPLASVKAPRNRAPAPRRNRPSGWVANGWGFAKMGLIGHLVDDEISQIGAANPRAYSLPHVAHL